MQFQKMHIQCTGAWYRLNGIISGNEPSCQYKIDDLTEVKIHSDVRNIAVAKKVDIKS